MDTAIEILAQLPESHKQQVEAYMEYLRAWLETNGECALLAFGLLGIELQEKI